MRTDWKLLLAAMATTALVSLPTLSHAQTSDDDPLDFLSEPGPGVPQAEPEANAPPPAEIESAEPAGAEPLELEGSAEAETETASDDAPPPTPAAPRSTGPRLDEIIVTAQKRAENVQDVPLSVTAIGGDALKENDLGSLESLSEFTPNLVITASPTFNYITLRGVGTGFNRGLEQSVAIIIDEVYYGRASYLSNGLLDLEAVEVLRGPQGTLFGKNSAAGAVHLRTANPQPDFELEADATYGTYDYKRARGFVTGPVPGTSQELMFRLAFQWERRDGFIENTLLDRDEQNLDQTTIRGKLLWEPTASFSLLLQGSYGITQQEGTGLQISSGTPRSNAAMAVFDPQYNDELNDDTSLDFPSFVDRKYFEVTGVATYEFDSGLEIKSITNYAGFGEDIKFDADFSPIPFITLQNDEDYTQFSQEIRFTSPPGEFEYVAGLYYFQNEVDATYKVEALANVVELALITGQIESILFNTIRDQILSTPLANLPGTSVLLNQLSNAARNSQFNPAGVNLGVLGAQALNLRSQAQGGSPDVQETATNPFLQKTRSFAAFFQANWHMSDAWTLIVGNRVSYEIKKLEEGGQQLENLAAPGAPSVIFPLIQTGSVNFQDSRDRTEFNVSPKAVLQYNGFYMGQIYASAAAGYKGGGFNAQPLQPSEVEFDEETSVTFEVGTKLDLFDGSGRFNIAVFYTFYDDFQSSAFNGTAFVPTNVGETRVTGVEWDGAQALTTWLQLTYSGSFIHSKYLDFMNGPCQAFQDANFDSDNDGIPDSCSLVGKHFGTTPRFTFTLGLGMDKPLFDWPVRLIGNISGSYATRQFVATDRDSADERPEYFLARGAIGLRDIDDVWSITLYGSNLTNLEQIIDGDDQPTFTGAHFARRTDPRQIKIEGRVRF